MLVLFPISENLDRIARGGKEAASLENERRQKAEELGKQLPFKEAIEPLESLDEPPSGLFGLGCLEAFAVAVGRRAPTADAILTRLTAGPLIGEYALLAGLLQSEPDAVYAWILGNITMPRIGVLGLAIEGELPSDRETTILDAIAATLTTAATSPTSVEPNTGFPDPLPASTELAALAGALARYLAGSRQRPVADRLERLAALGETVSAAVLPRVLSAVGQLLRPIRSQSQRRWTTRTSGVVSSRFSAGHWQRRITTCSPTFSTTLRWVVLRLRWSLRLRWRSSSSSGRLPTCPK